MTEAPAGPLILFDGVCNLCNSAVQWVIERDRRGIFRFGALQSEAGRAALSVARSAEDLPASIVLIDGAGTHTRSDAAIRIARGLGFPWSLAVIARAVPRPLRDAVYSWVARNRYRWFGRRESCMVPTAELAARFVDGSETVTAPIAPVAPVATSSASESVRGGFSLRFVLAYLVIYNLCFPVGSIPGTVWLGEQYQELVHVFVSWVARVVFGKVITVFPNGSGDTTYNYVEVFTFAIMAAAGAAAWTLARRGRPVSARAAALVRIYVRYALGATMLGYGWVKVMPLQFTSIGPDSMVMTYGDSSPMGLLWRFMGASAAYQMFAGLGEVLGGALLFWRRTTMLGALIAAGVLTNVAMLNFCFDVPVKLFSVHLLLMAAFLIAPDIMRLIGMIVLNIPVQPAVVRPLAIRRTWLRRAVAVGGVLLFAELAIHPAYDCYRSLRTEGLLAPRSPLHGVYQVESFTSDGVTGRDLPDDARWVRVGIHQEGIITFQRASGTGARYRFERDEAKGTLTLNRRDATAPVTLRFTSPEAGVVKIEGEFEGRAVSAMLRKLPDDSFLLTSRGFRWINEYPFNR